MQIRLRTRWFIISVIGILVVTGCAAFQPKPMEEVPFQERAQTKYEDNVRVTAAVLSAEESKAAFGVPLYKKGIQPIWFEIENKRNEPLRFLPMSVDRDYHSPLEVAYVNRSGFSKTAKKEMNQYFWEHRMRILIPPGGVRSGFVFTNLDEGTKHFNVDLIGREEELAISFTFFIPVPGLKVDHHEVDLEGLYPEDEIVSYYEEGFRKAFENLPCCTTNKDGSEKGDPLNLVVVGDIEDVYYTFIRAGWDETETIYAGSALKTGFSAVFGGRYRYSPISALYVFGRGQDVAFQKARGSIHERNHLRLWLAPMRFEGKAVWIGQISRDIGVRFTKKTITTHKIDPDVDETRFNLIQDLWYSQGLAKFAYVKGVGAASIDQPRGNLTGDPYFTDGYRAVLWVSGKLMTPDKKIFLDWEIPSVP